MKLAFFSTHAYDKEFFEIENKNYNYEIKFFDCHLDYSSAELAQGADAVCVFVNDDLSRGVLIKLKDLGIKLVTLRCAGFNNVDLEAAAELGIQVTRVPAYSPNAVAEHTVALILALNRKIHKAYNRTREANFSINGLMGFDLKDKTVGIIGFGKIGQIVADIMKAFSCKVLVYDPYTKDSSLEYDFVPLSNLLKNSDIITLHCPLTPDTHHLINAEAISMMKDSAMLINTSRGAVIDTKAVIDALKSHHIGYLGLDVYEEEADFFFEDLSNKVICDDTLARLLSFPNVIVTSHQAFFTKEAMQEIVKTTFSNINDFEKGVELKNKLLPSKVA